MFKTRDGIDAAELIGAVVQTNLGGGFFGIAEYLTADGWFGIRQPGGRLDECKAEWCEVDPT